MKDQLLAKIGDGTAVVAVVGLGYVGLPLAQHFVAAGHTVIGLDTDAKRVALLADGQGCLKHICMDWLADAVQRGKFVPSTDFRKAAAADAVIICVPTPLTEHREPDLSYVRDAVEHIARTLRRGQLVVLESTTYPGTTEEFVLPLLAACGLEVGEDFFLAFSPEREDPGNKKFSVGSIPKVVGGVTPGCSEVASALYSRICGRVISVSRPGAAELCKLLENIFRSVNIALVNELKMLCDRMGLDVWEIIDAAATKPFGFMPFYPGPGLGGHCIPIDPFYLTWKAREYGFTTRFIELSGEINTRMPQYVVSRVMDALNDRGKALRGARVLLLGVAYKADIEDMRESPALDLIRLLREKGAEVRYNDPHVPRFEHAGVGLESVSLSAEEISASDCVLIATAHTAYDAQFIVDNSSLVVDTRNMTKHVAENRDRIVCA
jgi:UDP-N-acetyl-D-glucosamine dehydrogenase